MRLSIASNATSLGRTALKKGATAAVKNPLAALEILGTGSSMKYRMNNGDSFMSAAFKETAENALYMSNPGLMTAVQMAPLAYQGVKAAHDFRKRKSEELHDMRYNMYGKIGGNYMDTSRAVTMRQAAVQQIQGNKLNARSALGGEARIFANNIY